ncbi:MAG TPA: hypothetical protein VGN96_15835 [Roseococcus sp.]|nr:hypothetical protein [Roseococcus sp.]
MSVGKAGQDTPRWLRLAAWLSAGLNLLLFNGSPDETLSGRAYRQGVLQQPPSRRWAAYVRWIDRAFFWQPGHCRQSHEQDRAFARVILAAQQETRA